MARITLLALLLLGAPSGASADEFDWEGFEAAFYAYLADPSDGKAMAMEQLLPAAPARPVYTDDKLPEWNRILGRLRGLEPLAARGDRHALRVAHALFAISDGEFSEWLSEILASGLDADPRTYLQELKRAGRRQFTPCQLAIWGPHGLENDEIGALYRKRIASLEAIRVDGTEELRTCSITALRQLLERMAKE